MELPLLTNEPLQRYNEALGCLKQAVANVVPTGTKVSSRILNPKNEDPLKGFGLGLNGKTRTMSAVKMGRIPNSQRTVETALEHFFYGTKPEPKKAKKKILYFDIETHSADVRWDMPPDKFFRLGQWAWGVNGKVEMTTSYEKMVELVREADLVVGHNIHSFDLSVLFGKDSIEPLEMALDGKVFDTMVHANLVLPAPYSFQMRDGSVVTNGGLPRNAMRWLGLDNLSYQLGTQGKIGDLRALAKKHGGFGAIPLDDPEFLEYAEQDIVALQELSWRLLCIGGLYEYEEREQLNAAIDAQNSRNGWLVDVVTAESRRDELAKRKKELLKQLQEDYGFPVEGKAPWATLEGKAAILKILKDFGIDPYSIKGWARTATGNISLGGKEIVKHTTDTPAQELGQMLAELKGQRSLSQLALDSIKNDGRVHPDISALQRSGRKSFWNPGLTIWTARGQGAVEKSYFIADPNHKLVELDFSNADARIVAAYSGDKKYAERFEPGMDGHEINGRIAFRDMYDTDPVKFRDLSKPLGHGYSYGAGARKLAGITGVPLEWAESFVNGMDKAFPDVVRWKKRTYWQGERDGFVVNDWGRVIPVEKSQAYTQAPAMYGQSGTRELMVDALIRMARYDIRLILWLVAQVHDALVFNIPEKELDWAVPKIKGLMQTSWKPHNGGQEIFFSVDSGTPADNWEEAGH